MKTNKKICNSEKYFKTLFESSIDGIVVIDRRGIVESANDSFFRIIKWPKEEIINKTIMKVIPDDLKGSICGQWKNVKIGDIERVHETSIKTAKGDLIFLNSTSSVMEINGEIKVLAIVRDISEKKEFEKELKESEEKYKDLFENANDPMYTHDMEGNFLRVNKLGINLLGGTEEEILSSNIKEWLTPESFSTFEDRVRRIYMGEETEPTVIVEVITKNGDHKFGEAKTRLIHNGDRVVAIHGIVRDITERMKLEKELRESEAKYRELFENANDGIYTHDLDGYFLTINDAGCRLLDCSSKDDVIGVHISRFLTPQSLEVAKDVIRRYTLGEKVKQPILLELISCKGKHLYVEFMNRIINENGRIAAIHGIARDITEKKKLEEQLRRSETKYRELFDNAHDPMYVLDMEGNFLKMNYAGLQILGCSKEELIGTNLSKWLTPESMKAAEEAKKRQTRENVDQIENLEVICKNGEHRWVEIKIRGIKDGEEIKEVHGVARDITENRMLKQELNKSNKQQRLLCYLLQGTRGGKTRAVILKHLCERSYNANQLAKSLKMDYKTIRHHLNVLTKNGIISKGTDGYSDLYFISKNVEMDLDEFDH